MKISLNDLEVGTKVIYFSDNPIDSFREEGVVKEVFSDHIILNVPTISDHIWIDEDFLDMIELF